MPDDVQHNVPPEPIAVATADDCKSQIPLIDCHFDALLAKQRARDVLHNNRLHPTGTSLTRSSPPRCTAPYTATTPRRRARHRDRQAITNALLRSAVTDLEDELILHIKKQCRSGSGAAKSASDVRAEQRTYTHDISPSVPKGNIVVPLMDLVVNRRKGILKSEDNDLI